MGHIYCRLYIGTILPIVYLTYRLLSIIYIGYYLIYGSYLQASYHIYCTYLIYWYLIAIIYIGLIIYLTDHIYRLQFSLLWSSHYIFYLTVIIYYLSLVSVLIVTQYKLVPYIESHSYSVSYTVLPIIGSIQISSQYKELDRCQAQVYRILV